MVCGRGCLFQANKRGEHICRIHHVVHICEGNCGFGMPVSAGYVVCRVTGRHLQNLQTNGRWNTTRARTINNFDNNNGKAKRSRRRKLKIVPLPVAGIRPVFNQGRKLSKRNSKGRGKAVSNMEIESILKRLLVGEARDAELKSMYEEAESNQRSKVRSLLRDGEKERRIVSCVSATVVAEQQRADAPFISLLDGPLLDDMLRVLVPWFSRALASVRLIQQRVREFFEMPPEKRTAQLPIGQHQRIEIKLTSETFVTQFAYAMQHGLNDEETGTVLIEQEPMFRQVLLPRATASRVLGAKLTRFWLPEVIQLAFSLYKQDPTLIHNPVLTADVCLKNHIERGVPPKVVPVFSSRSLARYPREKGPYWIVKRKGIKPYIDNDPDSEFIAAGPFDTRDAAKQGLRKVV